MWRDSAALAGGGAALYFGAGWLVRGGAGIAQKLRVPSLVIGLTVVAYGTSAPELVVGIGAALEGRGGIAFGNAVGSNIANLALILGMTALIAPPKVDANLTRRDLPALALGALAVPLLLLDGTIGRLEGAALVVAALGYTFLTFRATRASAVADAVVPRDSTAKLVGLIVLGLLGLLAGGHWLVDGASNLARRVGVPERVVGLTIVAIGTSVPELATSIVAARRGAADIAIGNVIGSNIFNVFLILGASALARPLSVSLAEAKLDVIALVVITLVACGFLRTARTMRRAEGAILLVGYLVFLALVTRT